jgi:predicted Holliday junction resolvase-like endonuclease
LKVRRIVEETAREVHEEWRKYMRRHKVKSHPSHWGEELMQSWEKLSERAKNLDRRAVKGMFKAFVRLIG